MAVKLVAYYRVSTKRQGQSGLGLEAQRAAAEAYAASVKGEIIKEFQEVETGKRTDAHRPILAQALPFAKRAGAVLVVAKLDRLARNAAFLLALRNAGVEFVACDNPQANSAIIGILAVMAEWEREQIATRTKDALQAAKRRGVKLGSARPGHWDGREDARRRGAAAAAIKAGQVHKSKAIEAYKDLAPEIRRMRDAGLSLAAIARSLNDSGHQTRRGAAFTPVQVSAILNREST